MSSLVAGRTLLLVGGVAAIVMFGGCGSSTSKRDPARVARLVAEANALCRSWRHRQRPTPERNVVLFQSRVAAVTKDLLQAAAYLPAGRSWKEARAKRKALETEIHKKTGAGGGASWSRSEPDVIERFYRLQLQIYDSVNALGITSCLEHRPRPPIGG